MTVAALAEDHQHVTVPQVIRVERTAGSPAVRVLIDGVELPWAVSAADPISVDTERDCMPSVRLTLVAYGVEVSDHLRAHPEQ